VWSIWRRAANTGACSNGCADNAGNAAAFADRSTNRNAATHTHSGARTADGVGGG
jgi:hypothetical protein